MVHDMSEDKEPAAYIWYNNQVYIENLLRVVWLEEYPKSFLWSISNNHFYYIGEGSSHMTPKDESSVPIEFIMVLVMLGVI